MSPPLLDIRNLSKSFPGVRALDRVSFSVSPGEVVALVGHNGSGKSTLVKVLSGLYEADPGAEIHVHLPDGELTSRRSAVAAALHFIHQDLALIPTLSTVENLDLGRPLGGRAWRRTPARAEERRARELIAEFGGEFDVHVPVATLTAAERTIVAIARALDGWRDPHNLLVLDEPTAALERAEAGQLFEAVRRVAERGAGVIFISHQLGEVVDLADRVVVLREGRVVTDVARGAFDQAELVRLITGKELAHRGARPSAVSHDQVFVVEGLEGGRIRGVDMSIGAGEIVGVTGLLGSGRQDLAGLLFGAQPRTRGTVRVAGTALPNADPRAAIALGVALVPADRGRHGAVMSMRARENLTLGGLAVFRRALGRLSAKLERDETNYWTEAVELRPADPERPLMLFSGGNQQKVVLAKWLRMQPRVLLLEEPTAGVDIGARTAIYDLVAGAAKAGAAVFVSSFDTEELVLLCDRVLVLREGRIAAQIERSALTQERLVQETLGEPEPAMSAIRANGAHVRTQS